jgi:hypothetical protein
MKALFALKSAINQSSLIALTALIAMLPAVYPEVIMAAQLQTSGNSGKALVFKIKDPNLLKNSSLTFEELIQSDPLANSLERYLEGRKSPLAPYAKDIIQYGNWKKALSISWVESNMCRRHVDKNCSGIGVAPGHPLWRKYATHLDWFKDMNVLLNKPMYTEKYNTFRKMKGVYVQPGSEAWVRGAEKVYAELSAMEKEATEQRLASINSQTALATFPQLANLD